MYSSGLCTLQEAYSVPSFDTPAKKKKACNTAPKASADPYDPYLPEGGRGEQAAFREGFQSYRGMAGDYNYYRTEYGIDTPKIREPFQQKCSSNAQRYDIPLSDADKKRYDDAIKASLGETQTSTLPPKPEMRKSDMSKVQGYVDDDLELYLQTKDMKAAPFTVPPSPVKERDPPAQPYDPDASPFAKAIDYFKGQLTPAAAAAPTQAPAPVQLQHKIPAWSQFWDIVMFVFAGILIMFLCDQLFKLAMLIGMKRTVQMLEPYLLQQSDVSK